MFFIAIANENYDGVIRFEETTDKYIEGLQVLPDVKGAGRIVESVRNTL